MSKQERRILRWQHPNRFANRREAGEQLAQRLNEYANQANTIVLALPRGGVPVAYEIAIALDLPLDVFLVRKLGVPWNKELAMGAVASGGVHIHNDDIMLAYRLSEKTFEQVLQQEEAELAKRERLYHSRSEVPNLEEKTIILVDDGLATGTTMQAAIFALKEHYHPAEIIVAVPVLSASAYEMLREEVADIVYLLKPSHFHSVGEYYEDFTQVTDSEAQSLVHEFIFPLPPE